MAKKRTPRTASWYGVPAICTSLLMVTVGTASAQKTDIVVMNNGVRVTCEIVKLERGRLESRSSTVSTTSRRHRRRSGTTSVSSVRSGGRSETLTLAVSAGNGSFILG